ncbi:MAG: hypothetical protein ACK5Q5_13660 [Planctomycetaceae bacterium]
MAFNIDPGLLTTVAAKSHPHWSLWEKKSLNIHRGLIELTAQDVRSVYDLARDIRDGARDEFRPSWFRGLGFGTIIHFNEVPDDFVEICQHVDTRNRRHGVWQWMIACFDDDKVALSVHTWLNGYLRPAYDSVLQQLSDRGYNCQATDAEVDPLILTLRKIAKGCRSISNLGIAIS